MSQLRTLFWLALTLFVTDPSLEVRDVYGHALRPYRVTETAQVLFFLSAECPISKFYAREIQSICRDYGKQGIACALVYEDQPVDNAAIRAHVTEFGYAGIPVLTDGTGQIAIEARASVTPQAVVVDRTGKIRYSGRIDNFFAGLGKPRHQATSHDLRDALDAIIAGRSIPNPETTTVGCFIVSRELFKEKK